MGEDVLVVQADWEDEHGGSERIIMVKVYMMVGQTAARKNQEM